MPPKAISKDGCRPSSWTDNRYEAYINPVPSGLVLTGIVVSVSVTAIMLGLTVCLYRRYHSLDLDEILMKVKKEWM